MMLALGRRGQATLVTDEVHTGDPPSHAKGPEIFIGLIGAVGTDLYRIREQLKQELRRANYTPEIIHLSKLMMDLNNLEYLAAYDKGPEDDRIDKFMDAGDAIRDSISRGDAVVLLGIGKIQDIREENQTTSARNKGEGEQADRQRSREIRPLNRRAYIFHSLKHPEEVRTLRRVYGTAFVAISVYSPRNVRKQTLGERIARSRKEYNSEKFASRADQLIEKTKKKSATTLAKTFGTPFRKAMSSSIPPTLRPFLRRLRVW
jgi:hypothetical protein